MPARIPIEAIKRFREAIDFLCEYARDQRYDLRFALEAKPNEPRGDIYFPTTAAYLGFIATLAHPDMVGVNPEFAHEQMAGLSFFHAVAQALEAGKLFHIDLNDQKPGRFDQDLRFGSESIKPLFFLVKLLEEQGYDGPRHFDAHAYRTEDEEGVWDFARGCMRTYLILKDKARAFAAHAGIQALLTEIRGEGGELGAYSREHADAVEGRVVRSPRARLAPAAPTSASISSSSICCSEPPDGARRRRALPRSRLQHAEPERRRPGVVPRPPPRRATSSHSPSTRRCRTMGRATGCCRTRPRRRAVVTGHVGRSARSPVGAAGRQRSRPAAPGRPVRFGAAARQRLPE